MKIAEVLLLRLHWWRERSRSNITPPGLKVLMVADRIRVNGKTSIQQHSEHCEANVVPNKTDSVHVM
jgi:hypothetical protein